jgi:hypothetical protein
MRLPRSVIGRRSAAPANCVDWYPKARRSSPWAYLLPLLRSLSNASSTGVKEESLGEKVFTNGCENIDENNFFVGHCGAVPTAGREVKHVPRRADSFLAFNEEPDTALHDDRHLFVRMRVFWRDKVWRKPKATDH